MNKPHDAIKLAEGLVQPLRNLYRNSNDGVKPGAIMLPAENAPYFDAICDVLEWAVTEPQLSDMFVVVTLEHEPLARSTSGLVR